MTGFYSDLHHINHVGDMSEHTVNGDMVSTGVKNSFSLSYSTADGTHEWAVPNGAGGTDVYHGTSIYERIVPNSHGSYHVYDSDMRLKATVSSNPHGGHDVLHDGTLLESSMPAGYGTFGVLHYGDPLSHLSEYSMSKLVLE